MSSAIAPQSTADRFRSATKAAVAAAYGAPRDDIGVRYEMDHLIPLAIGGSNAAANLWPEPWLEAETKDVLEVELQRQVCLGLVSQAQAQHDVAEDWVDAYRRYVLGTVAPTAAAPTFRQRVTDRLKADARRLSRSWIFGSE